MNDQLFKQIDGCAMGGPISIVLADLYMCKIEYDVVVPVKLIF